MLVLEYKLVASKSQAERVREGIRVVQFIRNKALRLWMDTDAKPYDLNRYCAVLAKEYAFANALNSQARQAAAQRAAYAIAAPSNLIRAANASTAPSSRRTTVPSNTKRRGGGSPTTAGASPSRTA